MDQIQDQNVQIAAQNFLASMENYYAMIGQLEAAIASPHSASLGPMGDDDPCWFFVANISKKSSKPARFVHELGG